MKKVLISGAGGFLGAHLCAQLAEKFHLVGVDLENENFGWKGDWVRLGSPAGLGQVVMEQRPDYLVHAAFRNRKPPDWDDHEYLGEVLSINGRLFETCASVSLPAILVSSSAVYGATQGADPIREENPRRPVSLYGFAKNLQELLAEYCSRQHGFQVTVVRLFNLIGPGQQLGMLIPDWVSRVHRIHDGADPLLKIRHQATRRDFVDVRDAARAVSLLLDDFQPGNVVNVASGTATALAEIVHFLRSLCRVPFDVLESEPELKSSDILSQCGDPTKIRQGWGWRPRFSWQQSLRDVWNTLPEGGFE